MLVDWSIAQTVLVAVRNLLRMYFTSCMFCPILVSRQKSCNLSLYGASVFWHFGNHARRQQTSDGPPGTLVYPGGRRGRRSFDFVREYARVRPLKVHTLNWRQKGQKMVLPCEGMRSSSDMFSTIASVSSFMTVLLTCLLLPTC